MSQENKFIEITKIIHLMNRKESFGYESHKNYFLLTRIRKRKKVNVFFYRKMMNDDECVISGE